MKKAYKLLRVRKDGTIGPLFINRKLRIPIGKTLPSEDHKTKGYAHRPGWHCTSKPIAPHLKMTKERAWYHVEISDYEEIIRPKNQGGLWFLAKSMKVIKRTKNNE